MITKQKYTWHRFIDLPDGRRFMLTTHIAFNIMWRIIELLLPFYQMTNKALLLVGLHLPHL